MMRDRIELDAPAATAGITAANTAAAAAATPAVVPAGPAGVSMVDTALGALAEACTAAHTWHAVAAGEMVAATGSAAHAAIAVTTATNEENAAALRSV
jgi:hypothetical protein